MKRFRINHVGILLLPAFLMLAPPAPGADAVSVAATNAPVYDLQRCVETALDSSYDIRKARERIRRQNGAVVEARARLIPNVQASATYNDQDQALAGNFVKPADIAFPISTESWQIGLQVTEPLYAGGGSRAEWDRQRLLDDAAARDLQAVINDVLLSVRQRYYDVLLARSQVNVQRQNVQLLQEELDSARSKLAAGTVSPFIALRAEVALANGQTPLIRARNDYRLAIEDLCRAMGLEGVPEATGEAPRVEVRGDLACEPYTPNLTNELAMARARRPELQRLALVRRAARAELQAAHAGNRPDLSVFAGYGAQNDRATEDTWDRVDGWQAGVMGTWNLFDGRQTHGRIMQAASDAELARLDEEQVGLNIDVEVRRAHAQVVDAQELVHATGKVVEQAEESVRLARSRFDAGAATQLDVLQTQVALTEARDNEISARHDYAAALAQLRRAMGVLDRYVVEPAP